MSGRSAGRVVKAAMSGGSKARRPGGTAQHRQLGAEEAPANCVAVMVAISVVDRPAHLRDGQAPQAGPEVKSTEIGSVHAAQAPVAVKTATSWMAVIDTRYPPATGC